nr:unnamed protein product [Callosobruchus chinensis]
MNNQALPRSHTFKLLGVSITENMIWHKHVSLIATAAAATIAGKKFEYLFRAKKYFSPSNLLTLYKAQIRPSLEYGSHGETDRQKGVSSTTMPVRNIRKVICFESYIIIIVFMVMVIGSLGGMRNTLLSALRAIPVCRAAAHILAARMQKAVILGSLRLLRAHDTRTQ